MPVHPTELLAVSSGGGPGTLLKWVIVVAILGSVFLAWFLLRGYVDKD
jgi:Mn2+/Fe2+ NRAMP family transporter